MTPERDVTPPDVVVAARARLAWLRTQVGPHRRAATMGVGAADARQRLRSLQARVAALTRTDEDEGGGP